MLSFVVDGCTVAAIADLMPLHPPPDLSDAIAVSILSGKLQ
jgi:hypothetical protein